MPSIGTLHCFQAIYMGLICLTAQSGASEQGRTWKIMIMLPSLPVSANLHSGLTLVQKQGRARVLLLPGCSFGALRQGLEWFAKGELSSNQQSA